MILLILSSEVLRYEMSSFANFDVEELLLLLRLRVDLWNTYVTDQPSPSSEVWKYTIVDYAYVYENHLQLVEKLRCYE